MRTIPLLAALIAACTVEAVPKDGAAEGDPVATPDGEPMTVDGQCDLPTTSALMAGAGATDCGSVPLDGDRTDAIACATAALDAGQAFHVAWEEHGIDSRWMAGWASDGSTTWAVTQDLGGEDPATFTITARTCVGAGAGGASIVCSSMEPVDSEYLVCGPECTGCNPAQQAFPW